MNGGLTPILWSRPLWVVVFLALWETTPVGDGLLFCGSPALGAMSSGLRGFIATRASLLQKFNRDLTPIQKFNGDLTPISQL